MSGGLWIFIGPSLSKARVLELCPEAEICPPAAQGDVWRALVARPRVIALIDGVFEASPSIWHHELLAALRSGVPVFGGASMGALRAAELQTQGMIGVGAIFRAFRDGTLVDDAEVAVLHADEGAHFRALTVPLVNVRFAASEAVREKILTRPQAQGLVAAAVSLFYQDRHWRSLLAKVHAAWGEPTVSRFSSWAQHHALDLKALDAEETIRVAFTYARTGGTLPQASSRGSSLVRRRRLAVTSRSESTWAASSEASGLRRSLLAGWARSMGVRPEPRRLQEARAQWLQAAKSRGLEPAEWAAHCGWAPDVLERHLEDWALDAWMMEHASRWLQDGPSSLEASEVDAFHRALLPGPRGRQSRRKPTPRRNE